MIMAQALSREEAVIINATDSKLDIKIDRSENIWKQLFIWKDNIYSFISDNDVYNILW